jgi:hypothetical protein
MTMETITNIKKVEEECTMLDHVVIDANGLID